MASTGSFEQYSKLVFGQEHRLAVVLFIARLPPGGTFTLSELASALGVGMSSLQRPLDAIEQAGFVEKLNRSAGAPRRPYRRSDSLLWEFAEELSTRAGSFAGFGHDPATVTKLTIQEHLF